jgi:hypothetical protein
MPVNPSIKNLENTQFGRVCTDSAQPGGAGNRHAGNAAMDDGLEPLLDDNGRLIVRISKGGGFVEDSIIDFSSGGAYTNELMLGSLVERNIHVQGYSDLGVSAYIQIHIFAIVPPPGNIPFVTLPIGVGPGAFFEKFIMANGISADLWIVISSTQFTYTSIPTPCLYIWGTKEVP